MNNPPASSPGCPAAIFAELDDAFASGQFQTESLASLARWVGDVCMRLINNAKRMTFSAFRSLKRSELTAWTESNAATFSALMRLSYDRLKDEMLYLPADVRCSYVEAVDLLTAVYRLITLGEDRPYHSADWLKLLVADAEAAKLALLSGRVQPASGLSIIERLQANAETAATELLQKTNATANRKAKGDLFLDEIFAISRRILERGTVDSKGTVHLIDPTGIGAQLLPMTKFSEQFKTTDACRETVNRFNALEPRLVDVAKIEAGVSRIAVLVQSIADYPSVDSVELRKQITNLAASVRLAAKLVHIYGYAATIQMVLEHNLVISFDRLAGRLL